MQTLRRKSQNGVTKSVMTEAKRIAARNARNSIIDIFEYENLPIQRIRKHKPDNFSHNDEPKKKKKKNTITDSSPNLIGTESSPVITVKRCRNIHPIVYDTSDDDDDDSISSIVTKCTIEKVKSTPAPSNNKIPEFINIDNLKSLQTVNCALDTKIRSRKLLGIKLKRIDTHIESTEDSNEINHVAADTVRRTVLITALDLWGKTFKLHP